MISKETEEALIAIVKYCGENLEKESRLLYPDPAEYVFLFPLLDKIRELGLSTEAIDKALVEGQDTMYAARKVARETK